MKILRFENLFEGSEMLDMIVRLKVQHCREKLYDSFDTSETFIVHRLICCLGTYFFLKTIDESHSRTVESIISLSSLLSLFL